MINANPMMKVMNISTSNLLTADDAPLNSL